MNLLPLSYTISISISMYRQYGVYISQLLRCSRACGSYRDFVDRWLLLTRKLLNQGLLLEKLISLLRNPNSHHHDLVYRYRISVLQMPTGISTVTEYLCYKCPRVCSVCCSLIIGFAARVTWRVPLVGQEVLTFLVYISSSMDISAVRVAQSLVFCVMFCRS